MSRRSRKAFSLVEIVVAIAIFATSAGILLAAIGNAYTAQNSLRERDTRHEDRREILRTLLAESENDSDALETVRDYRTPSGDAVEYRAEAEETPQAGLFRIRVSVSRGGDSEREEFVFYVFRPSWKSRFDNQEILLENLRERFPSDRFDTY